MDNDRISLDKRIDVLHDHFKETFGRQREVERSRDRHFLWVIVLFAVLSVAIAYPAQFTGSMQTVSLLGVDISLVQLPLAALVNALWVLTFAVTLRYCQVSIFIDRQYAYIHSLEEEISPLVGGGDLYRREGDVYLRGYPLLFNAAFYAYTVIFPIVLIASATSLWLWECNQLSTHWLHKSLDLLLSVSIIAVLFLYRMQPYLAGKFRQLWNRVAKGR